VTWSAPQALPSQWSLFPPEASLCCASHGTYYYFICCELLFHFISHELCKETSTSQYSADTRRPNNTYGLVDWLVDKCESFGACWKKYFRLEVLQNDFLWEWGRAERITSKVFSVLTFYDSMTQQLLS
jgi:hypothetical protein